MSNEHQKELFGEFEKEKGKLKQIADKMTQRQQKLYLHLPLENIIVAAIAFIMCIIIAFALGVERGKRLKAPPLQDKIVKDVPEKIEKTYKPYAIQLISYKEKQDAENELARLQKKKIDAFILHAGNWYQVCAGGYENIEEAQKALTQFRKDFEGCFVRKNEKGG